MPYLAAAGASKVAANADDKGNPAPPDPEENGKIFQEVVQKPIGAKVENASPFDSGTGTILMLVASGVLVFVDHARAGKPQDGNQYVALGVVGFALLFLGEFAPDLAFGFSLLILVSIILNSPNGLPFIPQKKQSTPKPNEV